MTEQTARRIERLLLRLLAVLDPKTGEKPKPGASVASVTRNAMTGEVRESDDADGDVPSALSATERAVMRAQDKHGRLRPGRRTETRRFE